MGVVGCVCVQVCLLSFCGEVLKSIVEMPIELYYIGNVWLHMHHVVFIYPDGKSRNAVFRQFTIKSRTHALVIWIFLFCRFLPGIIVDFY